MPDRFRPAFRLAVALALLLPTLTLAQEAAHHHHAAVPAVASAAVAAAPAAASFQQKYDFFTNYGNYLPRIHCIQTADGKPDWPWIGVLTLLNVAVMVGYLKIFRFWRQCYLAEAPDDRNRKLMDLAGIFLLCATCGYGFFIVTLFWPAYRLLTIFMVALSVFTWRFAADLSSFRISFSAKRLERELGESLKRRNDELESLVALRTAELRRANHFKGMFLANMSHEIRTPMTAILGFADLLADPSTNDGEQQAYVETIRRNGQHLLGLVNDVLDLSKIEAGKLKVEAVPVEIGRLVAETAESLRPRAGERGNAISVAVDPGVPRSVRTDPLRVRQILTNLLGNAIKFTQGGTISVAVRQRDAQLRIDVTDTGCGMSPHDLATVFNRFEQAGELPTSGTGLGLTISRNLARLLGGDITVMSTPGVGSTFGVTLGAEPVETHRPVPAVVEPTARPLAGLRVLVAEDAADTQTLLRSLLDRWGASPEVVGDGQAAVDRVAERNGVNGIGRDGGEPFDLVLLDIQMPRLDGLSAARQMREGGFAGPIIALTANTLLGDRSACLAAGCNDYVAKPIEGAGLLAVLKRARAAACDAVSV